MSELCCSLQQLRRSREKDAVWGSRRYSSPYHKVKVESRLLSFLLFLTITPSILPSPSMSIATTTTQRQIPLSDFPLLERNTEVSSVSLGSRILSCSDEWFAPASDLLKVHPAPSLKGQFGPKGALFDGWETRRHNPEWTDWVILRLGPKGGAKVVGFDVDTAWFNGNEAPEVEVFGLRLTPEEEEKVGDQLKHDDGRVRQAQRSAAIA